MQKNSPFDSMAERYDVDFTYTAIGKLQRKQVWDCLFPILESYNRPLNILEINCGTGEDAIQLATLGHKVTATDASETMLSKAVEKTNSLNLELLSFICCSFDQLQEKFVSQKFDLVISNFGGLNCVDGDELKNLSAELHSLLDAGGRLFLVIMSRACLWETFYFLLKGKPADAFRRRKSKILFTAGGFSIPVAYYSTNQLKKIFRSHYNFKISYPVGFLIPPSYLEKQFAGRANWLKRLGKWESRCKDFSIFSNLSDHFCIVFQKKPLL